MRPKSLLGGQSDHKVAEVCNRDKAELEARRGGLADTYDEGGEPRVAWQDQMEQDVMVERRPLGQVKQEQTAQKLLEKMKLAGTEQSTQPVSARSSAASAAD